MKFSVCRTIPLQPNVMSRTLVGVLMLYKIIAVVNLVVMAFCLELAFLIKKSCKVKVESK